MFHLNSSLWNVLTGTIRKEIGGGISTAPLANYLAFHQGGPRSFSRAICLVLSYIFREGEKEKERDGLTGEIAKVQNYPWEIDRWPNQELEAIPLPSNLSNGVFIF